MNALFKKWVSKKKTRFVVLLLVVCVVIVIVGVGIVLILMNKHSGMKHNYGFSGHGLPIISIDLNGVTLEEIDSGLKDTKYYNNSLELYNSGKLLVNDNVEIKGRGNGTWWGQEKKPYRIKFNRKINLLGLGKGKKWYLISNALDDTFLRNDTAFYIEEMLGMNYILRGDYIELYVNGDYRGLYYLTPAVAIGKNGVDLRDDLGILVELDNYYGGLEENYTTLDGEMLVIKDLVSKDKKKEAINDFLETFNKFEESINGGDYERIENLVDIDSFARYFLLSEFIVNPDAYLTSFYFYKDGISDKIHVGPGWDFDIAFGNRRWVNWMGDKFYSPKEKMVRAQEIKMIESGLIEGIEGQFGNSKSQSRIIFKLMEYPQFRQRVEEIFKDKMLGKREELMRMMNNRAVSIYYSATIDGEKWNKLNYEEELKKMMKWIWQRYDYFEEEYGFDK